MSLCVDYMNVILSSEANGSHDSSVVIATRYSADGPCFEPRWGARLFGSIRTSPETHQTSCTVTAGCLLGLKRTGSNMGRALSVPLPPFCACLACNGAGVFVSNSRVAVREIPHFSWTPNVYYCVHKRSPRVPFQFMVYQSPCYRRCIS
jgi:hypothetical protein